MFDPNDNVLRYMKEQGHKTNKACVEACVEALGTLDFHLKIAITPEDVTKAVFAIRTIHESISMVMTKLQEKKDQTNE